MKPFFLFCCLLVVPATPSVRQSDLERSPEVWETAVDLYVIDVLLELYDDRIGERVLPDELLGLGDYASSLPDLIRSRLPLRDGWGRQFRVARRDDELLVVSPGANGKLDSYLALRRRTKEAASARRVQTEMERGDDIVLVVGKGLINAPGTVVTRQRETMAHMRSIGTAVESFAIDHDAYPLQNHGWGELTEIREELESTYIREVPLEDAWGSPFLYWSDESQYVLVSRGADGQLDLEYDPFAAMTEGGWWRGATVDPDSDIIFAVGQFVQWPEGTQQ